MTEKETRKESLPKEEKSIQERELLYYSNEEALPFHAFLAIPSSQDINLSNTQPSIQPSATPSRKPAILIAHAWKGRDAFAMEKARYLARLGYVAFAADLYGEGKIATTNDEAFALMQPLFFNRKKLRQRISAAYDALAQLPEVDPERIGAIGFCFGGCTMLELLRSEKQTKGIVSFHGLLGYSIGEEKAAAIPWDLPSSHPKLLILHGYKDPLVSLNDITALQQELQNHQIDWQMHIYGQAAHAFTNPEASEEALGLLYHALSEHRSLQTMQNFFQEVFL